MLGADVWFSCQVGDGAGELHDAGAGAGGQPHVLYYTLQQGLALPVQMTIFFNHAACHGGVAEDPFIRRQG